MSFRKCSSVCILFSTSLLVTLSTEAGRFGAAVWALDVLAPPFGRGRFGAAIWAPPIGRCRLGPDVLATPYWRRRFGTIHTCGLSAVITFKLILIMEVKTLFV